MFNKRVLVATSLGGYNHAAVLENALAKSLRLRGADVSVLLCDKILPACQMTKIAKITPAILSGRGQMDICQACLADGQKIFSPLNLPILYFSQFLTRDDSKTATKIAYALPLARIPSYIYGGLSVGEHALAGTLRYYGIGDIRNELLGESVLRLYLEGALKTVYVMENLMRQKKFDVVCFHHGIYVPQGIIGEICRKKGIRVVNWNPAYRRHTFIFSHDDSYHHTMISEPVDNWHKLKLNSHLKNKIIKYILSRRQASGDWIWFNRNPSKKKFNIYKKLDIDRHKPLVGLLTNVTWDARLHYRSVAFSDMLDWLVTTIEYFAKRQDMQLVIRIHPAEISGLVPSRQPILPEIKKNFPKIPDNVFIVDAADKISTYDLMDKCNAVLIYNTKTGIELAARGLPVIVAGEAWIRNKGFSVDATSKKQYLEILKKLPFKDKLGKIQKEQALKYAYHYFFRRMIPLPFIVSPQKFKFRLDLSSEENLAPGNFTGLDIICNGILAGRPFIYPDEKYHEKK